MPLSDFLCRKWWIDTYLGLFMRTLKKTLHNKICNKRDASYDPLYHKIVMYNTTH